MGKPKGKYIHPDKKRNEPLKQQAAQKNQKASAMKAFVAGKR